MDEQPYPTAAPSHEADLRAEVERLRTQNAMLAANLLASNADRLAATQSQAVSPQLQQAAIDALTARAERAERMLFEAACRLAPFLVDGSGMTTENAIRTIGATLIDAKLGTHAWRELRFNDVLDLLPIFRSAAGLDAEGGGEG